MRIGLVHGRFQPFHEGHSHLVEKMNSDCDVSCVLIASCLDKKRDPFSFLTRRSMVKCLFPNVIIGGNINLRKESSDWDVLLSSCVFCLCGRYPTDIYCGPDYSVSWEAINPKIHKEGRRYKGISGTEIRKTLGL